MNYQIPKLDSGLNIHETQYLSAIHGNYDIVNPNSFLLLLALPQPSTSGML